jgi:tetratricopeptide (TPR) repeat protein
VIASTIGTLAPKMVNGSVFMNKTARVVLVSFLIVLLGPIAIVTAQDTIIQSGIDAFRRSDYTAAIVRFREALLDAPNEDTEATAYFWLAKSAMALDRLGEAERNLEYYIQSFPDHEFGIEARYQRGRLLFLQENYQAAIRALAQFIDRYPDSPFVANAFYWSAESLFQLGRLEEARDLFETVIRDYPASFRVEAARYRTAIIDLSFRERELLQLLQWSHEEYLQALDEFDRREQAYRDTIASYQQRLQNAASEDFREEIVRLSTQVRTLQETIRSRDAEIGRLEERLESRAAVDSDE